MKNKVYVGLRGTWSDVQRHLSRKLVQALEGHLHLVNRQLSSTLAWPSFIFDVDSPFLSEFLEVIEKVWISDEPKAKRRLFKTKQVETVPILRAVSRYTDYDYDDLIKHDIIHIMPHDPLLEPYDSMAQFYKAHIRFDEDCAECWSIYLEQTASLQLHEDEKWPTDYSFIQTRNGEILITDALRQVWQAALYTEDVTFLPIARGKQPGPTLWQVQAHHVARVLAPPTPLDVGKRCPNCQRPIILRLGIRLSSSGEWTDYTTEGLFSIEKDSLPAGHIWQTDLLTGQLRYLREDLAAFQAYPDPFFVRTATPAWLVSRDLLTLLQEHAPDNWIGKPVLPI